MLGTLTGLCYVGSIVALVLYRSKKQAYDPNTEAIEDRLGIARNRAVTLEQLQRQAQSPQAGIETPAPVATPKPWRTRKTDLS